MSDLNIAVRELQRRLNNMIKRGRIHSVDLTKSPPLCRVEYGKDLVTNWLPWFSGRASSYKKDWEPLAVGEQVMILSESGDLSLGVVYPSLNDSKNPVPSTSMDEHLTKYEDGTTLSYNRKTHKLSIDVKGDVSVVASGNVSVEGTKISSNNGAGVVTGECVCPYTGSTHADLSSTVFAGK